MKFKFVFPLLVLALTWSCSCGKNSGGGGDNPIDPENDLTQFTYSPTTKTLKQLQGYPQMLIPDDNPITEEGVKLGRMLFFDPILSVDSSMACVSCHLPEGGFTDNQRFSRGVQGGFGTRSSMPIQNVGYNRRGLFWDGRSETLEDQALLPVEDEVELHEDWENVEEKFRRHADYPRLFREAFGIETKTAITKDLAAKAIAQFERTMIVGENSEYYEAEVLQLPGRFLSDEAHNGLIMFQEEGASGLPDAQCFHCHVPPLFTDFDFKNNGLDSALTLQDFDDYGRGAISGFDIDNGKFSTPTLWNIALTAPYMHDGRFETLEEVLDHYASAGHGSPSRDPLMNDIALTDEQKADIIAFLHTLTDTTFLKNPDFNSPF